MIENGRCVFLSPEDEDYSLLLGLFEREIVDSERVVVCTARDFTPSRVSVTLPGDVIMSGVCREEVPPDQEALAGSPLAQWGHGWPMRDVVTVAREGGSDRSPVMATLVLDEDDTKQLLMKIADMVAVRQRRTHAEWARHQEEARVRAHEELVIGLEYLRSVANDTRSD